MGSKTLLRKAGKFLLRFVVIFSVLLSILFLLGKLEQRRMDAQSPALATANAGRVDGEQLMSDLRWLADPAREGRGAGTAGGAAAREWLVQQFHAIGLAPAGDDGFFQPFEYTDHDALAQGVNVIGRLAGTDASLPLMLVSAHYDHEGVIGGIVYPGADDNASGVAAMLAAARYFVANPPRHSILFIAFDAEEQGLKGARAFVETPTVELESIGFVLNADMVARTDDNELIAVGTWQHPWLRPVLDTVQAESTVAILFGRDRPFWVAGNTMSWVRSSDQGAFHRTGIPFLFYSVEDHADYHQPTDTVERIDPARFDANAEVVVATLLKLDESFDTFPVTD